MNMTGRPPPIVGWHQGNCGIVFLDPSGRPFAAFTVDQLQAAGWIGTDADYRRSLPRLDKSPLATP